MIGVKLKPADRWKYRPPPPPSVSTHVADALTPAEQARIDRWVASRIVDYPIDRSFCCRRPIVAGQKWLEVQNDDDRARFHSDCAPEWRRQQEAVTTSPSTTASEKRKLQRWMDLLPPQGLVGGSPQASCGVRTLGLTTPIVVPLSFSWKSRHWAWRGALAGRWTCAAPTATARRLDPCGAASIASSWTSKRWFARGGRISRYRAWNLG